MDAISPFAAYLAENLTNFQELKNGRRARKLSLAHDFWNLAPDEQRRVANSAKDPQQKDRLLTAITAIDDVEDENDMTLGMGIVLRTDYSDDTAWKRFCEHLRVAETEFTSGIDEETKGDVAMTEDGDEADSDSDSDDSDEVEGNAVQGSAGSSTQSHAETGAIFQIVSTPPSLLTNMSNIAALRMFNDVDIVPAPVKPQDAQRIKTPHRLMDKNGFVEAYTGNLIWIYDTKSNADGSVRVINQKCETYGAATGDSWRSKVSFMPELQGNLFSGAIKISFTGVDGWDHSERERNLVDA